MRYIFTLPTGQTQGPFGLVDALRLCKDAPAAVIQDEAGNVVTVEELHASLEPKTRGQRKSIEELREHTHYASGRKYLASCRNLILIFGVFTGLAPFVLWFFAWLLVGNVATHFIRYVPQVVAAPSTFDIFYVFSCSLLCSFWTMINIYLACGLGRLLESWGMSVFDTADRLQEDV